MVKGKKIRYELVYSNTPLFNRRQYHIETYTNNFDCIARIVCRQEIEEARKRIRANRSGTFYKYTPSKEYMRALSKFHGR